MKNSNEKEGSFFPKRDKKIYEFFGVINSKLKSKDYHSNEIVYKLSIGENTDLKKISVYERKVNKEIWNDVINSNFFNKKYIFYCEKRTTVFHLIDWKEIT